jgi:hypothetical protein
MLKMKKILLKIHEGEKYPKKNKKEERISDFFCRNCLQRHVTEEKIERNV